MKEKVSFISAFFGVCTGISIFHRLRYQSWGRTIFHVIFLGVLAGLLITAGELQRKKPLIHAARTVFEQKFGSRILNISSGLVPEKSPSAAGYITLPDNGRFWYFPSGRIEASLNELEKCDFLFLWAPRGFVSAVRRGEDKWTVSVLKPEQKKFMLSRARVLSTAALQKMELNAQSSWDLDDDIKAFSVEEISAAVYSLVSLGLLLQNLFQTLFLPLLYTGIFVGMFRLTSGGRFPVRLTFGEFWKIGFYAGFPALLVASAFPALDLPFFSFSTVYMIGLLGYWLYAATRLERELFIFETGDDSHDPF